MTVVKNVLRCLLFGHGLLNIAQGIYSVFEPAWFVAAAGEGFLDSPNKAVQSIGRTARTVNV